MSWDAFLPEDILPELNRIWPNNPNKIMFATAVFTFEMAESEIVSGEVIKHIFVHNNPDYGPENNRIMMRMRKKNGYAYSEYWNDVEQYKDSAIFPDLKEEQ